MRIPTLAFLGLLGCSAAAPAHEVVWKIEPTKKTKIVFEDGKKKFNWDYARFEPESILTFSVDEKTWMKALFPGAGFKLFRTAGAPLPDEYVVLPDKRVIGKDDFVPIQVGTDGTFALAFIVRAPDGLLLPEPAGSDDPASAAVASAADVGRRAVPGELHFVMLKEGDPKPAILFRSEAKGVRPGMDLLRFRSLALGKGAGFELAARWGGPAPGETHAGYRLFVRQQKGVSEAWAEDILDYRGPGSAVRVLRFALQDVDAAEGDAGEPELLVQETTMSKAAASPDPVELLPLLGDAAKPDPPTGLVRIHQLRSGKFRLVGWADRSQGDRPIAMRKNWPNYVARRSQGPSVLLSFTPANSPFDAYLCPWPDHPAREVPWLAKEHVRAGKAWRTGDDDLRLAVWFVHDPQAVYMVAVVRDDRLVLPSVGEDPGTGDHLQLWLDPLYGQDPFMLEVFPGSPPGAGSFARVKAPAGKVGAAEKVRVAARFFGEGYWLEVAIPYSFLDDMGVKPTGSLWGFAANAIDVDEKAKPDQKTVVSTSRAFEAGKPETFNNLILE